LFAQSRFDSQKRAGGQVAPSFYLQPGGEPLPGFVLHLPVGRGALGQVWEARGPTGTPLALKFIRCKNSTAATKEVRSFQSMRRIHHPHLLRVYDVFLLSDFLVISMELADGSLFDLLSAYAAEQRTPVPQEVACHFLSEAASVLDFLNSYEHQHDGRVVGFQHCDVKPSNLLIFGDRLKLADFGLTSPMTAELETHDRAGTLDFAGPEVYGGRLSSRTDQYALAVTYCLVRGGRMPFHNTIGRFTPSYFRGQPDLTMLSPPERPIVARALEVSPINRWNSCGELMAQLRDLCHDEPLATAADLNDRRQSVRLGWQVDVGTGGYR
jgi:serine/threonine protein kinase